MDDRFAFSQMGMRFFEGTMPGIVREMKRPNDLLERLVVAMEKLAAAQSKEGKP
jgi:hypothetical protein